MGSYARIEAGRTLLCCGVEVELKGNDQMGLAKRFWWVVIRVVGMQTENKVDSTGFAKVLHKRGMGKGDSRCGNSVKKDEPSESI